MRYKQVELIQPDGRFEVAFIPAKFAVRGKTLIVDGEDGWVVNEIYSEASEEVLSNIRYARKNREETIQ